MKSNSIKKIIMVFLLILSAPLVIAMPWPTGIVGHAYGSENPSINITVYAYLAGTSVLTDFRQTTVRESDHAYVLALTTDIQPNLDIIAVAVSADAAYHGMVVRKNIKPGDHQKIDFDMVKSTPEVPPPEIEPPGGGGGGSGGGGGAPPGPPVIDTDRPEMPPIDSDDEDFKRYLEDYYKQLQEEYDKWQEEQKQEEQRRQEERQYNTVLEYMFYLVLLGVLGTVYFIYNKEKHKKMLDAIVKKYLKNRKR